MSGKDDRYKPYFVGGSRITRGHGITSDTVTISGRRSVPSSKGETPRPFFPAQKAQRVTKVKLAAIQERDNAKYEAFIKKSLSQTQQRELDALRQEVANDGDSLNIPEIPLDNEWVDISNDEDSGSDAGSEAESAIVHELGLPNASSEWSKRLIAEHEAWTSGKNLRSNLAGIVSLTFPALVPAFQNLLD